MACLISPIIRLITNNAVVLHRMLTVPIHTVFKSRTKANSTTKRRRSFAFALNAGEALG